MQYHQLQTSFFITDQLIQIIYESDPRKKYNEIWRKNFDSVFTIEDMRCYPWKHVL